MTGHEAAEVIAQEESWQHWRDQVQAQTDQNEHEDLLTAEHERWLQIESQRQQIRADLYVPDLADSDDELEYLGTQVVEPDPALVYDEASPIASGGDSNSDSDDNVLPPLTTILNSQPRPVASTAPPPRVFASSSGAGVNNPPPPATAPGRPSRARKQTRKKASQEARDVTAVQVKARKKVERQEALVRKDMKQQEARMKARNSKRKEVSQLWQDEAFLRGYVVDLPIRSSQ